MTFTRVVGSTAATALLAGALGAIAASPAAAAPGDSDTAFNTAASAMILNNQIRALDELADGRIVIAGQFTQPRADVAILDADGGLDASFQVGAGIVDFNDVRTVTARQVNGGTKILIGGNYFDQTDSGFWRGMDQLNADGSLDQSFRNNMAASMATLRVQDQARAFAVQPDGKVLVGGAFCTELFDPDTNSFSCGFTTSLLRLNANGTLDSSFTSNIENVGWAADGEADGSVDSVQVQPDGKIVVGGNFGGPGSGVARFNSDGTPDTTFNNQVLSDNVLDGGAPGTDVRVALQSDGKIVAAGNFDNGQLRNVARFNTNGTPDTTFNSNIGYTLSQKRAYDLAIDSAGGILVGGAFTNINGNNNHDHLARFTNTGTLDTNFTPNIVSQGLNTEEVRAITLSTSNRIIVGGKWGSPANYIQRYYGQPETPAAPSAVTATAGNGQATVSWTAPSFNGGAGISGYLIDIRLAGGAWATSVGDTGSTTSHTITGLANGLAVEFRVAAINNVGAGDYSTGSNAVIPTAPTPPPADSPPNNPPVANPPATTPPATNPPATTPRAPTTPPVTATAPGKIAKAKVKAKKSKKGKRKYLLKLTAPGEDGGATITSYEYRIKAKAKRTNKKIKTKWTDWQSFNPGTQTAKVKKAINKLRKYPRGTKLKMQIRAVNSVGPGPATNIKIKTR